MKINLDFFPRRNVVHAISIVTSALHENESIILVMLYICCTSLRLYKYEILLAKLEKAGIRGEALD